MKRTGSGPGGERRRARLACGLRRAASPARARLPETRTRFRRRRGRARPRRSPGAALGCTADLGGLTSGSGLAMVALSAAAGLATLLLVWRERFDPARVSPRLRSRRSWRASTRAESGVCPGSRSSSAAAGRATLVAVVVGVAAGALVLVPSLGLLFALLLRGRLEANGDGETPVLVAPAAAPARRVRLGTFALAGLMIGAGLVVVPDSGWARAAGVAVLFASAASGLACRRRHVDGRRLRDEDARMTTADPRPRQNERASDRM